ncbi:MAG: hypothetical protein KBF74_09510 [Ferruginibacter sp.]|nr:hypothetical protein [Ferruginibacter sp.]
MLNRYTKHLLLLSFLFLFISNYIFSQTSFRSEYKEPKVYAGIEVGSKGVKMSIVEIGTDAQSNTTFRMLKDSSVNTDFISFTQPAFNATLKGLAALYSEAMILYSIPSDKIFTVISSGVNIQAEKSGQVQMIRNLADSFRQIINEPLRNVDIVDVTQEARLSHLGIIPDAKRYNTFLIDIGSGNTKGGFFPYDNNLNNFKLFQLTWGTKSVANAVEKKLDADKSVVNFRNQLYRVLAGSADDEIIYAVNASDAYNINDNIVFSGGIAWSVATLISPELIENPVIPVTYEEVEKFYNRIFDEHASLTSAAIVKQVNDPYVDKVMVTKEVDRVNKVFDQKSLLAGTGLLLKIMRQFEGIYEKKDFYLVKNGQVGWISAYVKQKINKQ